MKRRRYTLALDLVDNPELINAYERYHQQVWPEILESIGAAGIEEMEIYRVDNRFFMLMEVNEHFSFEKKASMDENNPRVQEWEQLMWKYQKALPGSKPGEKWQLMSPIFKFRK